MYATAHHTQEGPGMSVETAIVLIISGISLALFAAHAAVKRI
jgi:hypothetical protein